MSTLMSKIPEDTWSAVLKTPPEEKWLEGAWFQDLPSGECHLLCPLAAGDRTPVPLLLVPMVTWARRRSSSLFGLQAGHPTPLQVAHGGSLSPGPREFPPINSSLHHSLTEPHMGYSLPFPFFTSSPSVSPHCFRSLLNVLYEQCRRQKCNDHPVWARWYTFTSLLGS